MSRGNRILSMAGALLAVGLFVSSVLAQRKKAATGEEFFIISSIDIAKSQLVLMRPTEVTVLMQVLEKTTYLDEKGQALHLNDLRAGDTVWVTSVGGDEQTQMAIRIHKGPMTVQELHRLYLNFPQT